MKVLSSTGNRMVYITNNALVTENLQLCASLYHITRGDTHAKAVRVYRLCRDPGGVICSEWLLTRYRNWSGVGYSSILIIGEDYLSEFFSCERKDEKKMIEKWYSFVKEKCE